MTNGTIKNALRIKLDNNKFVAVGNIYNDSRNRYDNGEIIKTSYIINEENNILYTKNASYNIDWSSKTPISWNEYMKMFQ